MVLLLGRSSLGRSKLGEERCGKGVAFTSFWTDQEQKIPKQELTKFVYCDIKKPLLIVCAPSVELGAGPLAWGLPESSIAYVVKVVRCR